MKEKNALAEFLTYGYCLKLGIRIGHEDWLCYQNEFLRLKLECCALNNKNVSYRLIDSSFFSCFKNVIINMVFIKIIHKYHLLIYIPS